VNTQRHHPVVRLFRFRMFRIGYHNSACVPFGCCACVLSDIVTKQWIQLSRKESYPQKGWERIESGLCGLEELPSSWQLL
jgi:hypothetical protein